MTIIKAMLCVGRNMVFVQEEFAQQSVRAAASAMSARPFARAAVAVSLLISLPKSIGLRRGMAGDYKSSRLSHRRSKTIVDQVSPESISAAAHDIACRPCDVRVLAVGTCAIN
jgi:hypothetical protein